MSQVGNHIQRISSLYSKGIPSDDSRLSRRHIYDVLLSVRAALLFNKLNKNQKISRWNYSYLSCTELEEVPPHQCPGLPVVGCKILRTKCRLPKPINKLSGHVIESVSSIDGEVLFDETTWTQKKYKSHNKYTGKRPDFFIKDDYLYITVTKKVKAITIAGLFYDPIEVDQFMTSCNNCEDCNECPTDPMELDLNIDEDLSRDLAMMAAEELIGMFNKSREDQSNDSDDSLDQESK